MNTLDQQMKHAHALLDKEEGVVSDDWLYRTLQTLEAEDPAKRRRDYFQEWATAVPSLDPCSSLDNIGAPHGHGAGLYFTKPIHKE